MRVNTARKALGTLAAALLLICLAAPGAQASARCHPPHSKTLKRSAKARVYHLKHTPRARVYGCLFSKNVPHRLPTGRYAHRVKLIHLRGHYVGYAYALFNSRKEDSPRVGAVSYDLRAGKVKRRIHRVGGGDIDTFRITDLVETPHGSIAVIRPEEDQEDGCEVSYTQVVKADASGQHQIGYQPCSVSDPMTDEPMDNPDAIKPKSLTYDGTLVHWMEGSTDKSAPLY